MTTITTPVTNPNVTRSRLVLEIASEMTGGAVADAVPDYIQPKVVLRHGHGGRPVTLLGISRRRYFRGRITRDRSGDDQPRRRARRGDARPGHLQGTDAGPAIAVIRPGMHSVFAAGPRTGLTRFEDIAAENLSCAF